MNFNPIVSAALNKLTHFKDGSSSFSTLMALADTLMSSEILLAKRE